MMLRLVVVWERELRLVGWDTELLLVDWETDWRLRLDVCEVEELELVICGTELVTD